MFIDTYIVSDDQDCLKSFCDAQSDVIGPHRGTTIVPEEVEDGLAIESQTAVGDPMKWYACIRSTEPLSLPESIKICDAAEGSAVLGVWA